ncbi:hypothetical protein [Nonomuraea sp. SYSU D8015]|uniref:hypothetical protein n=1 Tax=Nonomuraea sp. SYSU D8015 TaxID=2593644 RepID=UPI001660612F|nr:hypothetical protein [Nonomuraea sp. SYSU D8015]
MRDFPAALAFYQAVLSEVCHVEPVKILPEAAYANWDIGGEAGLVLYGRDRIAQVVGTAGLPSAATAVQDATMLVMKVGDVEGNLIELQSY